MNAGVLNAVDDQGVDVTLTLSVRPSDAPNIPWIGAAALLTNLEGELAVTARKGLDSSATLVNIKGDVLLYSALKIGKMNYGFNNDQIRAYVEFIDAYDITVRESTGNMNNPVILLKYLLLNKYFPFINPILAESGVYLMNGNFIDYATIDTIYLCNEDRVLFTADVEKNQYFA